MIKTVVTTIGSRVVVMGFALGTVLLNTHYQGDAGQGEIALFNLVLLVLISIAHFISGGALVYLVPRMGAAATWKPAYLWTTFVALCGGAVVEYLQLFPAGAGWAAAAMCWAQALFSYHQSVLLGKERVGAYNLIQLLYAASLFGLLATAYIGCDALSLSGYITAALATMVAVWLFSLALVWKHLSDGPKTKVGESFKTIWAFGRWSQVGNVFQNLAYRAPYALMEGLVPGSMAAVGVFSINTYASEAVWNVGKSLSLVQYSRLSNEARGAVRLRLTLTFFRLSLLTTLPMVVVLALLPTSLWEWALGDGFGPVSGVLLWTGVGILVNAGTMIFSHHFAAVGKHKYNALGSLMGCLVVLGVGYMRIPHNPLMGAAQAFSAGMVVQAIVALVLFLKLEQLSPVVLLKGKGDLAVLRTGGLSATDQDPLPQ